VSVRTDITVNFDVSPRIITVAAPSVALTIQDLWDTLRQIEDELPYLSFDQLISTKSGGKISLGGGEFTGISLVMNNALLEFEARAGPTWAECQIQGGNIISVDSGGVIQWPINPTDYVNVAFRQSTAPGLVEGLDVTDADWLTRNEFIALK
jgi:hypothetical protein